MIVPLQSLIPNPSPAFDFSQVSAVVMDEFHSFTDPERGIVWELSLTLLPPRVRVLLLSATVGNPYEFARWLRIEHGREVTLIQSNERRVPLEFNWVGDKLITELLTEMVSDDDTKCRAPALVFCFNRDECWEVAERLKGLPIISNAQKVEIDAEHVRKKLASIVKDQDLSRYIL